MGIRSLPSQNAASVTVLTVDATSHNLEARHKECEKSPVAWGSPYIGQSFASQKCVVLIADRALVVSVASALNEALGAALRSGNS